ncbi:unnamed protein product [Phytophthora lilii]|uniref:Unnamed protein product n=1 Tax=Phytophthora lilii TaxID=2077276 RepID=A0A9W6TJX6_9STRA|nr:unnamed protein product [Phytophthora lilii]
MCRFHSIVLNGSIPNSGAINPVQGRCVYLHILYPSEFLADPVAMALLFQGLAWLLLEPKTTFYSPRYSQEALCVRSQELPFWSKPQVVLQLGQTEFLVLDAAPADAAKRSGDPKESKKLLQLTVRPLDDVRRAQLYQTAARAQVLEVFVDVEHTRERLLRCLRGEKQQVPDNGKLLDDAFAALEKAQQSRDRDTALRLYKQAERGFGEAEKVVFDDRSREFLRARRADLQRTIRTLEKDQEVEEVPAIPPAAPVVPEAEVVTTAAVDISARLEELRKFAAQQENVEVQQKERTDLAARFAALKNEKVGPAPPVDALAERLRRLRGDNDTIAKPSVGESLEPKSAVDRIIDQVTDEIALGIEDEEIDEENLDESNSDSKSDISSSSESSHSSNEGTGSKMKCKKNSSTKNK